MMTRKVLENLFALAKVGGYKFGFYDNAEWMIKHGDYGLLDNPEFRQAVIEGQKIKRSGKDV